jgi:23S rRNA U2552 (ribose-2'-O)-methylase RlmE/FtsJ
MNLEEKITKRINLEKNDGLSSFMGMSAQQTHNVYEVFYNFLSEQKPARILEIGTALGGFTQFLKWSLNELELPTYILSYDVIEYNWYKDIIKTGIDIRVKNVFDSNYQTVEEEVINFINQDGTTIVLCDGGYKVGEFNLLAKYLKRGDFIMAHDYGENREIFEEKINRKIWNWFEISKSDIESTCIANNLEIYNKETFEDVVWTCRKKI